MKDLDKPFWRSKKCIMYLLTLAALVGLQAMGADADVLQTVAMGLMAGLPVLLGGQAYADAQGAKKSRVIARRLPSSTPMMPRPDPEPAGLVAPNIPRDVDPGPDPEVEGRQG